MKNFILIFSLLFSIQFNAQIAEVLSSDRPGQAFSANVVGKNVFQIQVGVDFFESSSNFHPNSFFRYGLSERFELNSGFILSGNTFANNLESFTIGARYYLSKNKSKFVSSVQLSYDIGATVSNSQITYILGSSLSEKLSYTLNLGLHFNRDESLKNGIYVLNFSYALNEKIGVFVEPFGTFLKNTFEFNIDSGVYYLLNNNLQIDALFGENNGVFIGTGLTWRIPLRNKLSHSSKS